jgi:2-polyprenyl-3-methyl-5-hydroxy-6-metoxy-1,4-benzoquinol methylase
VGRGIARFLRLAECEGGRVLDFGCGPGYLLAHLSTRVRECYGVDFSREAVEATERLLQSRPTWRGATVLQRVPTDFANGSFDVVTCLETVEHLRDEQLDATLAELRRLVRPGGTLFLTTPNGEDLASGYTYCPFCDTRFHQWQHVRSLTEDVLRRTLEAHSFSVLFCQGIDLWRFETVGRPSRSLTAKLRWRFEWSLMAALDKLAPRPRLQGRQFRYLLVPGPNLCAVAT